jgi:peptidoglycan/LPS O-acetylase OafA/YrhL
MLRASLLLLPLVAFGQLPPTTPLPTATECADVYSRCKQSKQQVLASSIGDANLDPAQPFSALPPFLSTPLSVIDLASLAADPNNPETAVLIQQYMGFRQVGNFDACQSLGRSHYCTTMVTAHGGPSFGVCLPATCEVEDYVQLASTCVAARAVNQSIQLEGELRLVDEYLRSNNTAISTLAALLAAALQVDPKNITAAIGQLDDQVEAVIDLMALSRTGFSYLSSVGSTGSCYIPPPKEYDVGAMWAIGIGLSLIIAVTAATVCDYLVLPHLAAVITNGIASQTRSEGKQQSPKKKLLKPLLFSHLTDADEVKEAIYYTGDGDTERYGWLQRLYELTKCFSALETMDRLLSDRTTGNFGALNGLRTLSCCYIILGHVFMVFGLMSNPINQYPALINFAESSESMVIIGAFCAVDTFFFISGFLGAYTMLRKLEKAYKKTLSVGMYCVMVLHRYLRLTPIYAFALLVYMRLTPYLADGPFYHAQTAGAATFCNKWWWSNLLYINNVVPFDTPGASTCMGWSWYLANDFQFFLITPFLLAVYLASKRAGVLLITVLIVGCIGANGYLSWHFKADISPMSEAYSLNIYARPYARIAPYLVGILLGCYFHERKKDFVAEQKAEQQRRGTKGPLITTLPKDQLTWVRVLLYVASAVLMVLFDAVLIWDNYRRAEGGVFGVGTWSQTGKNVFNAFQRTSYAVGLAGVCHCFFTGHGGPIKAFLEHHFFDILAKLSYGAYLWALLIMEVKNGSQMAFPAFDYVDLLWRTLSCSVLGFGVSLVSYILLEKPAMSLEGRLMAWLTGSSTKRIKQPTVEAAEHLSKVIIIAQNVEGGREYGRCAPGMRCASAPLYGVSAYETLVADQDPSDGSRRSLGEEEQEERGNEGGAAIEAALVAGGDVVAATTAAVV